MTPAETNSFKLLRLIYTPKFPNVMTEEASLKYFQPHGNHL